MVVFIGTGKSADALKPSWKRLGKRRHRIRAVAMDLSKAYQSAVRTNIPRATVVFDRFHIVKLLNERLSDLRRELYRDATASQKKVLKSTRCCCSSATRTSMCGATNVSDCRLRCD